MYPVLFRLGPVDVDSFWVMVFLGFAAAGMVLRADLRRAAIDPRAAYDLILYAYVGGLVGARLFLLATAWDVFVQDPVGFLLSGSGWVWYGGLLGGTLAVLAGIRIHHLPLGVVADAAGPGLAIAQVLGRIGCQLAGDGDYGVPSTLPWAMSYPHGVVPTTDLVHPTPLYEAILYAGIFAVLWRQRGRRPRGSLLGQYCVLAGLARFGVEFVRINPVWALGLTLQQWLSLACAGIGTGILHRVHGAGPGASALMGHRPEGGRP